MIGNTSTIGLNATYASGNRANNKLSISKTSICIYNVKHIKSNIINSTIKIGKSLIYLQYIFLIIKNFHIQLILIIFSTFFVLLSKIK
jgi:hypothetical protein